MKPTIYLAAAYSNARFIDEQVAAAASARGFTARSTWHAPPYGPEDLPSMDADDVRAIADQNDRDLSGSDVVLVLLDNGRETLCELRFATMLSIPVVAVATDGRFPLSAYRRGVTRCRTLADAYDVLSGMAIERRAAS